MIRVCAINDKEILEKYLQEEPYAGAILAAIDTARTRLNANVNMELAMELLLLTMKNPS